MLSSCGPVPISLYIKDYVNQHRLNTSQEVQISSPDRFRSWLQQVALRTGRKQLDLQREIIEVIAPNACSDLAGTQKDNSDYYRDRALEEVRKKRIQNDAPKQGALDESTRSAEQGQQVPTMERGATEVTLHSRLDPQDNNAALQDPARRTVSANTSSSASRIEIELLPATPASNRSPNIPHVRDASRGSLKQNAAGRQ